MPKKKPSRKYNKNEAMRQISEQQLENERQIEDLKEKSARESTLIEDFETQLSSNEPVRELASGKNIKFKTELTDEQRGAVSILYHAYRLALSYGIDYFALKVVLDEYIDFGVSVDRKGRAEFVDALKPQQQQMQQPMQNQMQNQMSNMKM